VHMRVPEVCTGHMIAYRLRMRINEQIDTFVYKPAGAKGDRAIFVLRETPLPLGMHDIAIAFEPLETTTSQKQPLQFKGQIEAIPGRVALITLDSNASRLILVH
jgi:hypothetical protein